MPDMHIQWLTQAVLFGNCMSKDPETKVGACVVTGDNRQVSFGYNGFARGFNETSDDWNSEEKHDYLIHAELNAILNAPFPTGGCALYCSTIPCHKCLAQALNAGITTVLYLTPEKTFSIINYDVWKKYADLFIVCQSVIPDKLTLEIARLAREGGN